MSETIGKLCVCDRCGETVFLKAIAEKESDGGYTRWTEFEPFPDGWNPRSVLILGNRPSVQIGTLCPVCNKGFSRFLNEIENNLNLFMKKKNKEDNDGNE